MVHIGQKISERLRQLGVSKTELARKIDTSRENIYGILTRESIDTILLAKISAALEFDFFEYYRSSPTIIEEGAVRYARRKPTQEDDAAVMPKDLPYYMARVEYLEKLTGLQETLLREKEEKETYLKA